MFTIRSESLEASVLDPVADRARMGGRYCWGGYCNRVRDAEGRELMSGPEYPELPSAFNGEGLPEVFRFDDKHERRLLTIDETGNGMIIGCGLAKVDPVKWSSLGDVTEPCTWEVEQDDSCIAMKTEQAYADWACNVSRVLRLEGRTLYSETVLENTGKEFTLQWYAHPFFPLTDGLCGCRFTVPTRTPHPGPLPREREGKTRVPLPPGGEDKGEGVTRGESGDEGSSGYRTTDDGWIEMIPDFDWEQGCFKWLKREPGQPLDAEVRHPLCGSVRMRGDFPVDVIPVWANAHTLSIEPYMKRAMSEGERYVWSLRYDFGSP